MRIFNMVCHAARGDKDLFKLSHWIFLVFTACPELVVGWSEPVILSSSFQNQFFKVKFFYHPYSFWYYGITQYHSGARASRLSRDFFPICTSTQERWVLNRDAIGSCFCWNLRNKGLSSKISMKDGYLGHSSTDFLSPSLEICSELSSCACTCAGLSSVASEADFRTLRQKA